MLLRFPPRGGRLLTLAVPLLLSSHLAYSQTDVLFLQEATGLVLSRSADTETSRTGVQSALDMAVVAAQLPDPVLKLGANNVPADDSDRFPIGTDFITMRSASVIQEFMRTEKRRACAERFNAEASAAKTQRVAALAVVQRSTV